MVEVNCSNVTWFDSKLDLWWCKGKNMFPELSPSHKVQQVLCFSGDASPPWHTLQVPQGLCWGWIPASPYQLDVPASRQGLCSCFFHLLRNLRLLVITAESFANSCFCPMVTLGDWILQSAEDSKRRNFSSAFKNYIIICRVSGSPIQGQEPACPEDRWQGLLPHTSILPPLPLKERIQDLCVLQTTWHRCYHWHQSPIPSPSPLFPSCLQCLAFLCRPHVPRLSAAVPEDAPPPRCRKDVVISGKRLLPPRNINRAGTPQIPSASHPHLHLLALSLCVCPCCILGSQVFLGEELIVLCHHQVFDSQKWSFPAPFTNAKPPH